MADKEYKIKVTTEADTKGVTDLKKAIQDTENSKIKVDADIDDSKIHVTRNEIEDLNGRHLIFDTDIDSVPLSDVQRIINDLDGEKVNIDVIADDSEVKSAKMEVTGLDGEKVNVDIDIDDSEIRNARKEINDLNGENVEVSVHVDDSEIRNATKEVEGLGDRLQSSLGSTESAVTGLISGMAGKSIWETIYGTAKKAETNKILLKNMADTSIGYQDMYNTIDSTTDQSLISMQQLIPALNGIKAATGSNASTINQITPQVAAFGQYVYALTGSAAKAEGAMFDLSKGIKGAFASLDNYGVTEDALMRTGLWSGKEDDVEGYMNAVQAVTGDTSELMDATQGLEALMGKAFSRGGKRIGTDLLPYIKQALNGFIDLDAATDGWLSTGLLMAGGAISGITSFLSMAGQAINGAKMLKEAYYALIPAQYAEGTAGWFSIGWILVAIALGVMLGLAIIYLYNNCEWFREGLNNLGNGIRDFVNGAFTALLDFFNYITSLGQSLLATVGITTDGIFATIVGFLAWWFTLPAQIAVTFINIIAQAMGFGNNFVQTIVNSAINSVNGFMSYISSLPGRFYQELQKMLGYARDFLVNLPSILKNAAINVVKGWIFGTGEHSPGFMYDAFEGELKEMTTVPLTYAPQLHSNIRRLGSVMVDNFGNPLLEYNIVGNNLLNNEYADSLSSHHGFRDLIVNVENVDSQERVNHIVDTIRRELAWDNATAGRTI